MSYKPPSNDVWTPNPEPRISDKAPPWEKGDVWTPGQPAEVEEPGTAEPEPVDPQGGLVKAWSVSVLDNFEKCPYMVFLKRVKKAAEPEPEPNNPLERGIKIHKLAEEYVKGEISEEVPTELERYKAGFKRLRAKFADAMVEAEDDWAFTVDWEPVKWMDKNVWARMKLDALEWEDEHSAIMIDYKTGKKFGNEMKHNRAGLTYAVSAFMRYPDLEYITTQFWYLDKNDPPLTNTYQRNNLSIILNRVNERAIKLTSCLDFKPNPSTSNCKFCPYSTKGSGVCEWSADI